MDVNAAIRDGYKEGERDGCLGHHIFSEMSCSAPFGNFALSFCIVWLKSLRNKHNYFIHLVTYLPFAVMMF